MGLLKNGALGRFPVVGRMTDVALLSNTALRLAHRKGLVSDETAQKFGAASGSGGSAVSAAELAMAAAAALRLIRRFLNGRAAKKLV